MILRDRWWWALLVGGGVLFAAAPTSPGVALGLGLLAGVALGRPALLPPLVLLAAPFYLQARPLFGRAVGPVEVLIVLTLVGAGVAWWRAGRPRPPLTPADGLPLAFVVLGLLSLLASRVLAPSLRELRTVILEPVLFAGATLWLYRERSPQPLLGGLVAGAVLAALLGLGQFVTGQDLITAEGVARIRGPYVVQPGNLGSPNNLALWLERALPIFISYAVLSVGGWRWLALGVAGVLGLALFLTYSLGGWLAAALGMLGVVVGAGRWRLAGGLLVGLGVVGGVAALAFPERVVGHFQAEDSTTLMRLQVWQAAWAMVRDHPVQGIGLDNFLYLYRDRYLPPAGWREPHLSHPHNLLLDFWLRLGLGGPVVLGLTLGWLGRWLWRLSRAGPLPERTVALGVAGSLLAGLVHGLVDNSYFLPDLALHFWGSFAIVRVLASRTERASPSPWPRCQPEESV